MTTRFWFVRHGPTHAKAAIGWTDLPADLSDRRTVDALKSALPDTGVVVSSDLIRAIATADALLGSQTRLDHDADLREIHFGDWEGHSFDVISARDPDLLQQYWENPGEVAPPNGESWHMLTTRVQKSLQRLARNHANSDIICVVHFGVILAALGSARGLDPAAVMGFKIDPLSLTRMTHFADQDTHGIGWKNLGASGNDLPAGSRRCEFGFR